MLDITTTTSKKNPIYEAAMALLEKRNIEIFSRFKGGEKKADLAVSYKITKQRIGQIIKVFENKKQKQNTSKPN